MPLAPTRERNYADRNDGDIEQQRNAEDNIETRFLRGYSLNTSLPLRQHNNGFIRIPASVCHEAWRAALRVMRGLREAWLVLSLVLIDVLFGWLFCDLHNKKLNPYLLVAIPLLMMFVQILVTVLAISG
ncbi:hypothetical protein RB595_005095 [Gaeumannomyces hyphopodioides]